MAIGIKYCNPTSQIAISIEATVVFRVAGRDAATEAGGKSLCSHTKQASAAEPKGQS